LDPAGSVDPATAARRTLTGSVNYRERSHRGHDRSLHENIPSSDLNIARNPNPAEALPYTTSPKSARQKCRSCHAKAPFPTRLLPFSNSRVPCQNCSPSLFTVGDLQCLERCFSSCPKKVAVTFGCTYLKADLRVKCRENGMQAIDRGRFKVSDRFRCSSLIIEPPPSTRTSRPKTNERTNDNHECKFSVASHVHHHDEAALATLPRFQVCADRARSLARAAHTPPSPRSRTPALRLCSPRSSDSNHGTHAIPFPASPHPFSSAFGPLSCNRWGKPFAIHTPRPRLVSTRS
jgi:hypothetical protein